MAFSQPFSDSLRSCSTNLLTVSTGVSVNPAVQFGQGYPGPVITLLHLKLKIKLSPPA